MAQRRVYLLTFLIYCTAAFQNFANGYQPLSRTSSSTFLNRRISPWEASHFLTNLHLVNADLGNDIKIGSQVVVDNGDSPSVATARGTLLFVSMLYGTNFGCVKILGDVLEPSFAALLRFSLAGIVFLPFLLKDGLKKSNLVKGGLEVGLYAGRISFLCRRKSFNIYLYVTSFLALFI